MRPFVRVMTIFLVLFGGSLVWGRTGQLNLRVVDQATGEPIAVRMHLKNPRGRAVLPKGTISWNDHFVVPGIINLELTSGQYSFVIERGPEYRVRFGSFEMKAGATGSKTVEMLRIADLKQEGWWSGDLHIHRPVKDIELLMQAEDLHVAPVITWWNDKNSWEDKEVPGETLKKFDGDRYYDIMAGEDERGGGGLLYFNRRQPLPLVGSQREYPASTRFLVQAAGDSNVHIDIEKPFWWDMPIWIASQKVDSIEIAHNHMLRDGVLDNEAWGKPRPKLGYPGPIGNGRWTQDLYYKLLNAGIRLPPSAGSASGVLNNPVGYNRVYVHVDGEFTHEKWWQNLREGRVFVTNGPLLRATIRGKLPGYTFNSDTPLSLQVAVNLATRDKIDYLEIIKNGEVAKEVPLNEYAKRRGQLPAVEFKESGWLIVRAVTNVNNTYRFASTGPFYVEIGQDTRISRTAVKFFQDWVDERTAMLKLDDANQQEEVHKYLRAAAAFWAKKQKNATAP
jgi:hypothetical protein